MESKGMYQCKSGTSNKFWSYEITGPKSVLIKWGRVGLEGQQQAKSFGSEYVRNEFVQKKIGEKVYKGYQLINEEKLEAEADIAQTLGFRFKIQRVEFIADYDDNIKSQITIGQGYDPEMGVFAEVVNSWTKDICYLIIDKKEARAFLNASINEESGTIKLTENTYPDSGFVAGIRKFLKDVAEVIKDATVKFGAVGVRMLSIDGINASPDIKAKQMFEFVSSKTGVNNQIISKFAALGARALEL